MKGLGVILGVVMLAGVAGCKTTGSDEHYRRTAADTLIQSVIQGAINPYSREPSQTQQQPNIPDNVVCTNAGCSPAPGYRWVSLGKDCLRVVEIPRERPEPQVEQQTYPIVFTGNRDRTNVGKQIFRSGEDVCVYAYELGNKYGEGLEIEWRFKHLDSGKESVRKAKDTTEKGMIDSWCFTSDSINNIGGRGGYGFEVYIGKGENMTKAGEGNFAFY